MGYAAKNNLCEFDSAFMHADCSVCIFLYIVAIRTKHIYCSQAQIYKSFYSTVLPKYLPIPMHTNWRKRRCALC